MVSTVVKVGLVALLCLCSLVSGRKLHRSHSLSLMRRGPTRRSLLPLSALCRNSTLTEATFNNYISSAAWTSVTSSLGGSLTLNEAINTQASYATNLKLGALTVPVDCVFKVALTITQVSGFNTLQRPHVHVVDNSTTCPFGNNTSVLNTTAVVTLTFDQVKAGLKGSVSAASCTATTSPLVKSLVIPIDGVITLNDPTITTEAEFKANFTANQGICLTPGTVSYVNLDVDTLSWQSTKPSAITDMFINQLITSFNGNKDSFLGTVNDQLASSLQGQLWRTPCLSAPKNSVLTW